MNPFWLSRLLLRLALIVYAGSLASQAITLAAPKASSVSLSDALIGRPFVQEFGPEHHGAVPEVWGLAQADNGDLLAVTDDGLIVRSGGKFELISLPAMAQVTALAPCGARVAAGGYEQFGHLERDAGVSWVFREGKVPADVRLSRVPDVGCRHGKSYFASLHWLLIQEALAPPAPTSADSIENSEPTIRFIYSEAELSSLFNTTKGMLVSGFLGGLFQVQGDQLVPLPGADQLPKETVMGLIEQEDALLIFMRQSGIWRIKNGVAQKLVLNYQNDISRARPYVVRALADGKIAIGTSTGELWLLAQDLSLVLRFSVDSQGVMALATDAEQGLWVATQRAMFRVSWPSPWTVFDERFGLLGLPAKIAFYKGRAFVASSQGIFEQQQNQQFAMIGIANEQAYDLALSADGLLGAYARGIYSIDRREFIASTEALDVFSIYVDPTRLQRMFVIHYNGVAIFELISGQWQQVAELGKAGNQISAVLRIAHNDYLLNNDYGVKLRLRLSDAGKLAQLTETQGAPKGSSWLLEFPEGPVISQDKQFYLWQADRWQRSNALEQLIGARDVRLSYISKTGQHWIADTRFFAVRADRNSVFEGIAMPSPGMRNDCLVPSAGSLFLCTTSGLSRFSSAVQIAKPTAYKTQIRQVLLNAKPVLRSAPLIVKSETQLKFQFSVNSTLAPVRYRSRLIRAGQASEAVAWSGYSDQASVSVQELPAGTYLIEAQAQTADLREAGIAAMAFEVQGDFWSGASGKALRWALALAGVILLIALSAIARNFVLRRNAKTLQLEVSKRTFALAEQTNALKLANAQLAALAHRDGLTGIANRREFDVRLQEWLTRTPPLRETIVLALLDLDQFKQFNDSQGHLAGDDLLRRFASLVDGIECPAAQERLFARYGGEEFALMLRIPAGQSLDFVHPWFDAIRTQVQLVFLESALTISLGYQQLKLPIGLGSKATINIAGARTSLIEAADAALYQAKNSGRNRIFAASVASFR